jgi:hypothetical protein
MSSVTPLRRVLAGIQFVECAIWGGLLYYVSSHPAATWDRDAIVGYALLTPMVLLHGAAGLGLALARTWGTKLQAVAASVGLVRFPFGTIASIVTLASLRGLNDAAAQRLRIAVIVTTWVLWQLLIFLVVGPAMRTTMHRDTMRDTLSSLGAMRVAVNGFRYRHAQYPHARTFSELIAQVPPDLREGLGERDAWGTPFRITCDGNHCVLVSAGGDRQFEQPEARWYVGRPREGFDPSNRERDIVVVDDELVRYPDINAAAAPGPAARP